MDGIPNDCNAYKHSNAEPKIRYHKKVRYNINVRGENKRERERKSKGDRREMNELCAPVCVLNLDRILDPIDTATIDLIRLTGVADCDELLLFSELSPTLFLSSTSSGIHIWSAPFR